MTTYKSKTWATWIALLGGAVGFHRFYLHGLRDVWGWLWAIPTWVGAYGFRRAMALGQDDHLAWVLIPLLGISLSAAALAALVYGLTPDEKWNERFNPQGPKHQTGWPTVIAVVLALLAGATVLMSTIAFGGMRFFEYQALMK